MNSNSNSNSPKQQNSSHTISTASPTSNTATFPQPNFPTKFSNKNYEFVKIIGEGTYSTVLECIDVKTDETVSIKKIKRSGPGRGVELNSIRELTALKRISHRNVVTFKSFYFDVADSELCVVMEVLKQQLDKVINNKKFFLSCSDIKTILFMILDGVSALHDKNILHRDIKPENLLISNDGVIKIIDFGMSRVVDFPQAKFTPNVVTRWYRAPELLLNSKHHSAAVDLWSCGCIFAELLLRTPFFPGQSDVDQLNLIFTAFGTPSRELWAEMTEMPFWLSYANCSSNLAALFTGLDDEGLDLLYKMLELNPIKRISAKEALKHSYFMKGPLPGSKFNYAPQV